MASAPHFDRNRRFAMRSPAEGPTSAPWRDLPVDSGFSDFARRGHYQCIPVDHDLSVDSAHRGQPRAALFRYQFLHSNRGMHGIAGADRRLEAQVLAHIRARTGQPPGDCSGDDARRQRAVGDAAFELCGLCEFLVDM